MSTAHLVQSQDDNWTLEITRDSGIREAVMLGRLSKEQAQREALARVRSEIQIICLDKDVVRAIEERRLRGIEGLPHDLYWKGR